MSATGGDLCNSAAEPAEHRPEAVDVRAEVVGGADTVWCRDEQQYVVDAVAIIIPGILLYFSGSVGLHDELQLDLLFKKPR